MEIRMKSIRATDIFGLAAAAAMVAMLGCKEVKPVLPKKPLATGTYQMHFTRKVLGPLDITIDGIRIPIEQKKKKGRTLTISGLSEGKHTYFLVAYREIIGPDLGEIEIGPTEGVFRVHFAKRLKLAFANPTLASVPTAPGIPGVTAVLE
jgi:hypothetical protein